MDGVWKVVWKEKVGGNFIFYNGIRVFIIFLFLIRKVYVDLGDF